MSNVGRVLHGYCRGVFGRNSYGDKRIEAYGYDWVVVREEDGEPNFAYLPTKADWDELFEESDDN